MYMLIRPTEAWGERAMAELKEGLGGFAVNKLTYDELMGGTPVEEALAEYDRLTDACDGISAFNCGYDQKLIRGAYRRAGRPDRYGERPTFCTMRGSGALLKQRGIKLGKVPNLEEAVRHLLQREHGGAHKVVADAMAAADLYRLLLKEGLVEWKPQVSKKGNGDE
jgi:DNA polymerase III epsilon subunit-like protein